MLKAYLAGLKKNGSVFLGVFITTTATNFITEQKVKLYNNCQQHHVLAPFLRDNWSRGEGFTAYNESTVKPNRPVCFEFSEFNIIVKFKQNQECLHVSTKCRTLR